MTLYDRKYEFNDKNLSLCEINCTFKGYNENTSTVQCECIQKQGLNRLNNENDNLINKLENNKNILNIDVIQCTDILNNSEDLKNNPGFYTLIFILVIFIIIFIIFCIKGYNSIKDNMENVIYKVFKTKRKNNNNNIIKNFSNNKNNIKHKTTKLNKKIKYDKFKNKQLKNIQPNNSEVKNIKSLMIDKKNKSKNEIIPTCSTYNIKNNIEIKSFLFETDYELNNSEYKDALKYDKRTACEYYYSLLKSKQLFIFTFLSFDDYNSGIIKKYIFFLSFALHYTINTLFFNDSNMHQIYNDNGLYNFKYQYLYIILSSIFSIIILRIILICLVLTDKYIYEIKLQSNIEKANKLLKKILKCILIKFSIFFILNLILLIIFWYYLTCWNAIYKNTQFYLLKNTLISFSISLIYPFIINIIPVILRKNALQGNKKEYLYRTAKIIQLL